jgi:RND family efflux transporter MFP subunit
VAAVAPARGGSVSCSGWVEDEEHARIAAAVMARVAVVHVREGDVVAAGAPLIELDGAEVGAMRAAALARAGAASARANVARSSKDEAELSTERERRLVALGATPRATVDDGDARLRVLGASIGAANADAAAAQAEVAVLDARLALHRLVAPFAGTVVTRPPAVGDVALVGVPLFELAGALVVVADVPEARLASIALGAPAEVRLDAIPEPLAATVVGFAPRVEKAKATATVKLRLARADVPLRVGMAARVRIDANERNEAKEGGR